MGRFDGRFAAVTGAASGNGRAISEKLLTEGAKLAALDMNAEALEREFGSNPNVLQVVCNVADEGSARDAMIEIEKSFPDLMPW